MTTVRQALAENWNAIGDIIIANAAPEKRETTMLTIKNVLHRSRNTPTVDLREKMSIGFLVGDG